MLLGVSARQAVRGRINTRVLATRHLQYSTSSIPTVPLAYDLHEAPLRNKDGPPRESKDPNKVSPILFLHGLFGSKKNNRSISKYVSPLRQIWTRS